MRALLPAALVALFAGWCGTFYYGAAAPAVAVGHAVLLGLAAWAWRGWDPLRLGPLAKVVPPLLWLWVLLSMRASPVPRAGWLAAALLPAFLVLPAAISRCWNGPDGREKPEARRRGALGVTVVAGVLGVIALVAMALQGSPRAAQPLGNAVVEGAVLATLLPLAVGTVATERGRARAVAGAALLLAGGGLLATRSIAALGAALVGGTLALGRGRRRWLLLPALVGALLLGPRVLELMAGEDLSALARWSYWQGGVRGIAARPLLGWGPGSTPWTLAPFVRPRPGINPSGEVLGDVHSLPVQIGYELGVPGLAAVLALGVAFGRARLREIAASDGLAGSPGLRLAGLAGLAAGAASLAAGPTLGTTAPWVALAVVAGAALPPPATVDPANADARTRRRDAPVGWLYAAIGLLLVAPLDAALACYGAARHAAPARARQLLAAAVELDPGMPLYRARLGWIAPTAAGRAVALAAAANGAPGVAALQLAAGWAAQAAGRGGERELERACAGDPLDGHAPFLLAQQHPDEPWAPRLFARALLANPTFLSAVFWEGHPELFAAALREVAAYDGVDDGFRQAIVVTRPPRSGRIAAARVTMDADPTTALSLHAFRRLPWPATLASVTVRRDGAVAVAGLPTAGSMRSTRTEAFPSRCFGASAGRR
jgi:hypothetical protein